MEIKMPIYDQPTWPNLVYENIGGISKQVNRIKLKRERLVENDHVDILISDIINSSAIEDEIYLEELVRKELSKDVKIEMINMVYDAKTNYIQPMTEERLYGWYDGICAAFGEFYNNQKNHYRKHEVYVLINPNERFVFMPPYRITYEMERFLIWLNDESSEKELMIKAAIAHFYYLVIHPTHDFNGRTARAITDYILSKDGKGKCYSLSTELKKKQNAYYRQLEIAQSGSLDITQWIRWFLNRIECAIDTALKDTEYKSFLV